jgi:predicted glycoside hydrolase/deacetylase ChbG (UPF0249 family)
VIQNQERRRTGLLVINADDWGLDRQTTDRILACALRQRISSASAMVFMEDSERAAELGRDSGITTGLHLNFTTPFSSRGCSTVLVEQQREIVAALRRSRFSGALFHPGLRRSFEYVVAAQLEEFERLYGAPAARLDGHHHMHLCPNVLWAGLLPEGATVRRSFSFLRGEKSALNRLYRSVVSRILARRHVITDYFFSLAPLEPLTRVQHIFSLASTFTVEVETHPAVMAEYDFLMADDMLRLTKDIHLALPKQAGSSPRALA